MPTPMLTGSAARHTKARSLTTRPDSSSLGGPRTISARPASATTAPPISHLSCCRRSPDERRQLKTWRAANASQNGGSRNNVNPVAATSVASRPPALPWPEYDPFKSTRTCPPARAPASLAARAAEASTITIRYARSTHVHGRVSRPSGNSRMTTVNTKSNGGPMAPLVNTASSPSGSRPWCRW